jgi:carboxyl-terminal processing protease
MKKGLYSIIIIVAILIGFAFTKPADRYFEIAKSLDVFATLFKEVNTNYVDEVEPGKVIRIGIDKMLESLDPYTIYIPEEDLESFRTITTGQYAGIGALIGEVNNKTYITHPYKDFPAYRAGARVGDEIISIDGINTAGKTTAEVSALLKGEAKTQVELRLKRSGVSNDITLKIVREKITISNITYYGMVSSDVAYIKLDDFTPGAAKEVSNAITKLKQQGAKNVILDLRENPGGLMNEAINIVNLFIPRDKEVVSTKGKVAEWNKTYNTLNNPLDTEIPIAILISEGSASASEIVSGALQDYDRAVLLGTKTFGKGLVQTTRELAYNSQLKVTTAKYHIPSGRCIQALDYATRKEDGSLNKRSDSLRIEFKTKGGRTVFDGNGIDPDIVIDDPFLNDVTVALIQEGLIFEYASKYCSANPTVPDLKSFKISDAEYVKFMDWAKARKFSHKSALEETTDKLIDAAKHERYFNNIESQLTELKKRVELSKASELIRLKKEISQVLEPQIAFHYALIEGESALSLPRDKTVAEAVKVLSNSSHYKSILAPR